VSAGAGLAPDQKRLEPHRRPTRRAHRVTATRLRGGHEYAIRATHCRKLYELQIAKRQLVLPAFLRSAAVIQCFQSLTTYPGGAILFVEGQMPRGVFVLCSGKVKLSTTSREGKVLILKMVEPGEAIGLSAVISGEAYEVTAETLGPCLVNLVERDGLLRLMERDGELGLRSAQAVSREFPSHTATFMSWCWPDLLLENWQSYCCRG
jgi:hypothetical protein